MTLTIATPSCPPGRAKPNGFTLIELLVVASIMAMLFGLVLVGGRPNTGATLQRAAQQFASVLLATQSRAIGKPEGAAVILAGAGVSCSEVLAGARPPLIRGPVGGGLPPPNPAVDSTSVSVTAANGGDLSQGYRIRFHGDTLGAGPVRPPSAWFAFEPPGTVRFRTDDGQSATNTSWPAATGGPLHASVICYPARGSELMEFPARIGIDLRYSGTGDDPTTIWGGLANAADIGLSFDTVGTVDALMRGLGGTSARVRQPVEPVYFLVNTTEWIKGSVDEPQKYPPLGNDQSLWVTVHPQTGRVTVSSNVPQAGNNATAVRAARASARASVGIGK